MKLASSYSATALVTLALTIPTAVRASLKHTDSIVFQQLADLTRPEHLKHLPDRPFGSIEESSRDLGYQAQGVDWKVTKAQYADAPRKGSYKQVSGPLVPGLAPTFADGLTEQEADANGGLDALRKAAMAALETAQGVAGQHTGPGADRQAGGEPDQGATGTSSFAPIRPPSLPLAVKGPYVNAWLPAGNYLDSTPPNKVGNGGYLAGQEPAFWTSGYGATGDFRLGWHGFIRIDNTTYQWMGDAFGRTVRQGKNAEQLSAEFTATKTIFRFEAAGVRFNVTFMTPVWPDDLVRQSIPLSYLHFELDTASAEGRSVQVYADIDERWITAHTMDFENYPYNQDFKDLKGVARWYLQRDKPQVYTEFRQRAEWGNVTWAVRDRAALYARNNNNVVTQLEFLDTGILSNHRDRVAGDNNAFAYAVDFDAQKSPADIVFAIGQFRDPYVNYIRAKNPGNGRNESFQQDRYGLWAANFTMDEAVTFFVNDFENALKHCTKLDAKIAADARAVVGGGAVGDHYAAITQLSVRQSLATTELTISKDKKGGWNTSDTLMFLKEISSNGDMSTVDVMFPQFPLLTYLNPELLRLLMLPIFEYTESGLYPNKWCVHDLGVYPNAFGHNDGNDEPMQVEESGNMILMTLHWAQLVGKKAAKPFLRQHYRIMQQWAEFLVEDSLVPASQLSTDDFAGVLANQTNLALKGIEGIAAMGVIADWIGESKNASYYANVSSTYIQKWQKYAIAKKGTHTKLAYQDEDSWGTLYNLFGDRLLNLKLVPKSIYDLQDSWYPKVAQQWGVPLDSRHNWTKSDWEMFASAISPSNSTRNLFINKLFSFYTNGRTDAPATDLYESTTGDFPKQPFDPLIYFIARPVVGGHFMHLALAAADKANGISASNPYQYGPPTTKKKGVEGAGGMRQEPEQSEALLAAIKSLMGQKNGPQQAFTAPRRAVRGSGPKQRVPQRVIKKTHKA
ncbi:unnamed protein product [Parajaminaea phylloscopi]